MARVLLLALACGGCAGIYVRDVERAFAEDEARVVVRAPARDDPSPAHAAAPERPFAGTERVARAYLDARPGADDDPDRYVRSLLACALLAQGRTAEARDVIQGIQPRQEGELTRANAVVLATSYAVGACRAVDARESLLAAFEDETRVEAFLSEYGSFVRLGAHRDSPRYEAILAHNAATVRKVCFSDNAEQRAYHRGEMRRLVGEQLSDDTAALLTMLPPAGAPETGAPERWLATVGVGCLVVQGWVMEDLVPFEMTPEERARRREEKASLYGHGRAMAGHFLDAGTRAAVAAGEKGGAGGPREEAFRDLYAQLLNAEIQVEGWIETR